MLVAQHQRELLPVTVDSHPMNVLEAVDLVNRASAVFKNGSIGDGIHVALIKAPGRGIYITQELFQCLRPQQEVTNGNEYSIR